MWVSPSGTGKTNYTTGCGNKWICIKIKTIYFGNRLNSILEIILDKLIMNAMILHISNKHKLHTNLYKIYECN